MYPSPLFQFAYTALRFSEDFRAFHSCFVCSCILARSSVTVVEPFFQQFMIRDLCSLAVTPPPSFRSLFSLLSPSWGVRDVICTFTIHIIFLRRGPVKFLNSLNLDLFILLWLLIHLFVSFRYPFSLCTYCFWLRYS